MLWLESAKSRFRCFLRLISLQNSVPIASEDSFLAFYESQFNSLLIELRAPLDYTIFDAYHTKIESNIQNN